MSLVNLPRHRQLPDGRPVFVKQRDDVPDDFFPAEARGLDILRRANALRMPEVFEVDKRHIVLEDLGHGSTVRGYWRRAGRLLARQHTLTSDRFGFDHAGFCGDSPQDNTPDDDGWRFFAERRLLPQARRGRDAGLLERSDVAGIERICARMHDLIPDMPAALLHGDLWTGNLHTCADGTPALIDAGAVHHGWAEAELAMLTLFGSPPPAFFEAYRAHAPLRGDWHERAPIYNLYHLLNHVNLFGRGYVASLRSSLAACA